MAVMRMKLVIGNLAERRGFRAAVAIATILTFGLAPVAVASRTQLKPGFNLFSPQQDVEVGRQSAQQVEKQMPMLRDSRVNDYVARLGRRIASRAPENKGYPFQFRAVNDSSINAFALPGGFLFVNRGAIEAADNEAQLAGVIGHEIGHVVLRHGTNQVSKAYLAQVPLAFLGGAVGSNSITGVLAQLGVGIGLNSLFLKYSRSDEKQADLVGTQIMYDCGYDPRELGRFFQKLDKGGRGSTFFSDHPSPGNRIAEIQTEIDKLGGPRSGAGFRNDSQEFEQIKSYLRSLPPAPKTSPRGGSGNIPEGRGRNTGGRPAAPSGRFQTLNQNGISLGYPDNWRVFSSGGSGSFTLAPEEGIYQDPNSGGNAIAYGVMASVFQPTQTGNGPDAAADELIRQLQSENPNLRVSGGRTQVEVGGAPAVSVQMTNESPAGGAESDWLVASQRPEGLVYFVFVAPQAEYSAYRPVFEQILSSIRFQQ